VTHLCVSIFVNDLAKAQREIAAAAEGGADMVELRIDRCHDRDDVQRVVGRCSLPCIVTCRPAWEGGQCDLEEDQRLSLLEAAAAEHASYIDVELVAYARWRGRRPMLYHDDSGTLGASASPRERRTGLIVSSHDFQGRPARLSNIIADLNGTEGDVAKNVWTARTVRDNLDAFEILQQRQKPTIALCMGEAGLISRVLAKKFGAFLTFAALDRSGGTAPGQIPLADMKKLYRWDAIDSGTKVYGVVGSPVAHSMSLAIHNAAFDATGFDGIYLPLLVEPSYESFKAFMETFVPFEGLDLSGLSVTIPHKENALRYLIEKNAEVGPLARTIGAVNTIVIGRSDSRISLRGMNTDYAAILDCITDKLGISREGLKGMNIGVIGAGGTGRTAVAGLAHYGAGVTIYNRTLARAEELAHEFDGKGGRVVAQPPERLEGSRHAVYFNATSIGMHPKVDQSPWPVGRPVFSDGTVVFDAVYNPMKTRLLEQAEQAGARTIGGVEMFLRQAAAQFQAWTDLAAPVDVMRRVIESRLGKQG
jgi:3-dehydroquinate dehydratase / shikimate dehydrogenase